MGLGRLRNLERKQAMERYEWVRPSELINVDMKTLDRFRKMGHRITGDRQKGRSYGAGYAKGHVAVIDTTLLTYIEVLADEQKHTEMGFLSRTIAWFNG